MVQGRALVLYLGRCVLIWAGGGFLVDFASFLGFPPFLGWTRLQLVTDQYFIIITATLAFCFKAQLEKMPQWAIIVFVVTSLRAIWVDLNRHISNFGKDDIPAREKAVKALQAGAPLPRPCRGCSRRSGPRTRACSPGCRPSPHTS